MFLKQLVFAGSLVATLLLTTGCDSGPKRYEVSGTVKYKGEPIKNGIISFVPKGSNPPVPAAGAPITEGKYEIPSKSGLLAGEYEVMISVPTAASAKAPENEEEGPGEGGEKATAETLPSKYNSTTELKAEVKSGEDNVFNFDLK